MCVLIKPLSFYIVVMGKKSKQSTQNVNIVINEQKRNILINKLNKQIKIIINELAKLQTDTEEEAMIRISDLTQERDRLIDKLESVKEMEVFSGEKRRHKVDLGDNVLLKNGKGNLTISLVGDFESDPGNGDISINSPLGQKVIDRKVGDEFEVNTPGGLLHYKVLKIS
jgi:transcription elongation factor GreA